MASTVAQYCQLGFSEILRHLRVFSRINDSPVGHDNNPVEAVQLLPAMQDRNHCLVWKVLKYDLMHLSVCFKVDTGVFLVK